jgi:hypothetical protein
MRPWLVKTNNKNVADSFYIPLWAPYKPKDFYFAVIWEEDVKTTIVYIVPADYFDLSGKMFEDSMPILQYLPTYLEEVAECEYETHTPILEVQRDMVKIGFIHHMGFQRYISDHGRYGF